MNSSSNIVLIGFMGSGKSTVGRILAKKLHTFFIDSDTLIEAREGMTVSDIFAHYGEAYFRDQEQACLDWISGSISNSVISTGGGLPVHAKGIKKAGRIVFLKSGLETILKRIEHDGSGQRPLAENREKTASIFAERLAFYEELSDIAVDAEQPAEEVAEAILGSFFGDGTA